MTARLAAHVAARGRKIVGKIVTRAETESCDYCDSQTLTVVNGGAQHPTDHAVLPPLMTPLTPNTCRAANATVVGTTGVMWTGHDALFVPGPAGAVGLVPSGGLCGVRVGRGELACGGRCSPPTHHMQAEAAVVDRASWFEHPIERHSIPKQV